MWKRLYLESCLNGKYLTSIIDDDSMITCNKIIEETKAVPTNFNEKSAYKTHIFPYFTCLFINYYSIIDSC